MMTSQNDTTSYQLIGIGDVRIMIQSCKGWNQLSESDGLFVGVLSTSLTPKAARITSDSDLSSTCNY